MRLGELYEEGRGVEADVTQAVRIYERSCQTHHAGGCVNLGVLYLKGTAVEADAARARSLFDETCTED